MLRLVVGFQIFALLLVERTSERLRRQEGQGSVEYLGVIIAAALLVLGIIALMKGGLITKVKNAITHEVDKIISNG